MVGTYTQGYNLRGEGSCAPRSLARTLLDAKRARKSTGTAERCEDMDWYDTPQAADGHESTPAGPIDPHPGFEGFQGKNQADYNLDSPARERHKSLDREA